MKKAVVFIMILIFSGCNAPTVELCEKCNGAKNFVCEKCNGSGSLICPVEDCEYGKIGKCEYCEEDKGVYNCSNCDDGIIKETCEVCSGKGTTINKFTQQTSTCEECNGVKEWSYTCKYCAGCGLICHYCRLNMTKYPNPAYKVYYEDCKQCSSTGYIQCDECLGMKTSPCSKCSVDEYNLFIEDFNKKKEAEQKKNNAIDEVLTLLSGKILTIETLKQAEDLSVLEAKDVPDAVCQAKKMAKYGDVVLLSPGAPSYHVYKNFEARGDDFKKAIYK